MNELNERTKRDFLVYANSVIKSRAIPSIEDNLKPIHRKILYTLYKDKVFDDKPTRKCATEVGKALLYSPHGDTSVYDALVRMGQWWKLRYPLIYIQGNGGNLLGDSAAAMRYTECRLSPIGMLMLEDLDKQSVDFKPNYDGTTEEPITLPSRFPYILCGNNNGIAVGLSSGLVSHNYTEVAEGIKYYIDHKDCSIADLMNFIKGPDFPTAGKILNGEDLLTIYSTGRGAIRMCAHYDITKNGQKTILTFHDLPYGVEIDNGIKAPLKKLIIEEGYETFENFDVIKAGPRNFDIVITLSKNADVKKCLDILFTKTRLADTIKVNQTLIVNGEPKLLNLKQLIEYWVNYRAEIIRRINNTDLIKVKHKLIINNGLQKCMSNIDRVIQIVRFDETPKATLMKEFELTDEQATAVLDIKLARLSKLEIKKLEDEHSDLTAQAQELQNIVDNLDVREQLIKKDLDAMKKIIGADERLTEIYYSRPNEAQTIDKPRVKEEYRVYENGVHYNVGVDTIEDNLVDVVFAYNQNDIMGYNAAGEMSPLCDLNRGLIGAFNKEGKKLIGITKNGNIKVSLASDYKFTKMGERIMKIKDGDELVFAATANDDDYLILFNGDRNILKLAVKDLPVASKLTLGVKSGFTTIGGAAIGRDSDNLLFVSGDNKGKLTPIKDFSIDSRGNKGQLVAENTKWMRLFENGREYIYIIPNVGKGLILNRTKVSIKSRTAGGATLTTKKIRKII